MDTHVDVHGDGRGPNLLLVHGFLSSRGQWAPNLRALAEVCTPVTLELLGHGRSASPDDPAAYTAAAYVERFEALRRELGVERWFVCGQSFGAGLTIRYALEHPERIAGQVFTNSISGFSPPFIDDPKMRDARADALRRGGRAALQAMPLYPKPSRRLPQEVWRELVDDAELLSPAGVAETIRTTVPQVSVAADLNRVVVPSLLINGRREGAFQPLRDLAAREIADLTIVDLEGGHAVNLDCPDAFNAAVTAFMASATAG